MKVEPEAQIELAMEYINDEVLGEIDGYLPAEVVEALHQGETVEVKV